MINKPNPYANTLYLAVHLALNVLVVVLVINIIDQYAPLKQFIAGHHLTFHNFYTSIDLQKNIASVVAIGAAVWLYRYKKAKSESKEDKHSL
jgi:hypothetical protein